LPSSLGSLRLRHALEVRHKSFMCSEFIALARRFEIATVFVDSESYPRFADTTADFVYTRLRRAQADIETGYSEQALDEWTQRARMWARGAAPDDLPRIDSTAGAPSGPREVFMFFINGAKERAPAAAMRLISKVAAA
jgi:uncharacterized protein YecE (DUF72 family)